MARYGTEHKQATRRRILDTAGRRLKSDGVVGSGVATLMADAGLTNGAFYAHFASKDDLVASMIADQLGAQRDVIDQTVGGPDGVEQLVRGYLSAGHRDQPGEGCPSAALLGEISRSGREARTAYTEGILGVMDVIAARVDVGDPQAGRLRVLSVFAGMVGTLQMARVVADPVLSDALLEQGITNALDQLGVATDRCGPRT